MNNEKNNKMSPIEMTLGAIAIIVITSFILKSVCQLKESFDYDSIKTMKFEDIPDDFLRKKDIPVYMMYFSHFLQVYCKSSKDNIEDKVKLMLLKMYHLNKLKSESKNYMAETIKDIPEDYNGPLAGKPKGVKLEFNNYSNYFQIFIFIIISSKNLTVDEKKDIISSIIIVNSLSESSKSSIKYNSKDKTLFTGDGPMEHFLKIANKVVSIEEFKNIIYDGLYNEFFNLIKIIDEDLINFNFCN